MELKRGCLSRRMLLERTCLGFGSIVLNELLRGETQPGRPYNDLHQRAGHFPARAKAVIQLVQNGGPSQMDLFDPKPELQKRAGQPHPDGVEIHQPNNQNILLPSTFQFRKYGQCGMKISEALPQTGAVVDDLCLIRSMHTAHNNHLWGGHPPVGRSSLCHFRERYGIIFSFLSYTFLLAFILVWIEDS